MAQGGRSPQGREGPGTSKFEAKPHAKSTEDPCRAGRGTSRVLGPPPCEDSSSPLRGGKSCEPGQGFLGREAAGAQGERAPTPGL